MVLNRELTATPSVVPSRFTPKPEKFEHPISQELRGIQARLAQGFAFHAIEHLESQLHLADYKREGAWQGKGDEKG